MEWKKKQKGSSLLKEVITSLVNLHKTGIVVGGREKGGQQALQNGLEHSLNVCWGAAFDCGGFVFWNDKHLHCLPHWFSFLSLPSSYKSFAASRSPGQLIHSCCSQPGMWDRDWRDSSSLLQWTWSQKTPDRRVQRSSPGPDWSHHIYSATRTGNQWMKNRWEELEWCGVGMGWQQPLTQLWKKTNHNCNSSKHRQQSSF